jgi:hypothetical protein
VIGRRGTSKRHLRFRAAALVVVLGFAVLAAACGTTEGPVAHDALAFRPEREVPPIERLGRWDGTTFVPVSAGSVRSGDLYVLVHGWAAGYLAAVRRYRGPGPLLAWSPQAVNAAGQPMFGSFLPLAAAITRQDPKATVLGFSWLDDSATALSPFDAWESEARTDLNGQRLAAALGQVVAPTFLADGGRIHLIGHSHGAKVATVAAVALDRPPAQLTLLDSPESLLARLPGAANHLEGYLPLLPIGRAPGQTFVDSYFSIAGERYDTFPSLQSVLDVQLDPAQLGLLSVDDLIARHSYPVAWYADSANDRAADVGFSWSPLVGAPPDCLVCFFRQDWVLPGGDVDPARELDLTRIPVTTARAEEQTALDVEPLRGPVTSVRPDGVVLTAPGQRLWQVGFDHNPRDLAIEFDDRFTSPRPGSQLGVWLDDRQVFATAAVWSGASGHHAVIDVSSLSSGRHTLTAVLTPPARQPAARVVLGGFVMRSRRVAATPDSSLSTNAKLALLVLLLFLVLGLLAWWLRLRRGERTSVAGDVPAADH